MQIASNIPEIAAIRFANGRAVPLEQAFDFADANPLYIWPREVIWADGSMSYAKGWVWSGNGRLCEIGAGAYGNMRIATRPEVCER